MPINAAASSGLNKPDFLNFKYLIEEEVRGPSQSQLKFRCVPRNCRSRNGVCGIDCVRECALQQGQMLDALYRTELFFDLPHGGGAPAMFLVTRT